MTNPKFKVGGVVVYAEYIEDHYDEIPFPTETGDVMISGGNWAVNEKDEYNYYEVSQEQIEEHYDPINLDALRELRKSGVEVPGDEEE